jgi:hypothetical protein
VAGRSVAISIPMARSVRSGTPTATSRPPLRTTFRSLSAAAHDVPLALGQAEARLDHAEGDGVHVDLERSPLARDRLGEPDQARLGRGVVGRARVPEAGGERRDVDHLAEALDALLRLALGRLPQVRCRRAQHAERHHHVDVELSEALDGGVDHRVGNARHDEVAGEGDGALADLLGRLLGPLPVHVGDQHPGAVGGERATGGEPDALGPARDDRDPVVEQARELG